jgi:Domain of unknown function (DUF4270)
VQKRILSIAISALLLLSLLNYGCSKLDKTDIGSDLLPAVDNVNTFDTLIEVTATQGLFNPDTTIVNNSDDHALGKISNDPLFGTTVANIYAQFKPTFFPYYYGNANDTIVGFDSVVLCLSYKGNWGDSVNQPLDLQVREVALNTGGKWDSLYQSRDVNFAPSLGNIIGSTTVNIAALGNYVVYANKKDSVKNQIRIKLSNAFANALFTRDTLVTGNNHFRTDSAFRTFQNGIAILANGGGNVLLYTNFSDSTSKLEVHYRRKNAGAIDTVYSAFRVNTSSNPSAISPSATANNIIRNRAGYPVSNPAATDIYLQTSPGTYANIKFPGLENISNRVIHRAEVIIEQIPTDPILDKWLAAPDYLYMDLKDTSITTDKWKAIYFDLNPNASYDPDYKISTYFPFNSSGGANIDFLTFGGYKRSKKDVFGNDIKYYNFNITRYVQQIVTRHTPNYTLRLFAPYDLNYPQYFNAIIPFPNRLASGRVKIGSGTNVNYKMRLRLVYSKI